MGQTHARTLQVRSTLLDSVQRGDSKVCGVQFWQTKSAAILTEQKIPPECISAVIDRKTNQYIFGCKHDDDRTTQPPDLIESKVEKINAERLRKRLLKTDFHQNSDKGRKLAWFLQQQKREVTHVENAATPGDDPIEVDWGEEEPGIDEKDIAEVPPEVEETYDEVYSQTACPDCDTQLPVATVLCHICGNVQEIGNSFTQAQSQKIIRANICFLEEKLHIRIYRVPATYKCKGPHARRDKDRDTQRRKKGLKWARKARREGHANLMVKFMTDSDFAERVQRPDTNETYDTMEEFE